MVFFVAFVYLNALKANATTECRIADACHVIRDGDTLKATAMVERPLADACHTIPNDNALKAATTTERPIADDCYTSIGWNNTVFAS